MEICPEKLNLVKIGQKFGAFHMKTLVHFIVACDFKLPQNTLLG